MVRGRKQLMFRHPKSLMRGNTSFAKHNVDGLLSTSATISDSDEVIAHGVQAEIKHRNESVIAADFANLSFALDGRHSSVS